MPVWNPLQWDPTQFTYVLTHIVGANGVFGPAIARTFVFVLVASSLCLLIAFPVAYYVARLAGQRKGLLLALLIAPFWISYMMRMFAWVNLLQDDGLVNKVLSFGGLFTPDVNWLTGQPVVVVLGLVYGYVPYMILPLYAGLDRLPQPMLEASRDLGADRFSVVLAGHSAAVPPDDRCRGAADVPADARRLLHQRHAIGIAEDRDGRQPDQRQCPVARTDRTGGRIRHAGVPGRSAADALLHPGNLPTRRGVGT